MPSTNWQPPDLPGLRITISLYNQVRCGAFGLAGELRLWMDECGISPKGEQDRRWQPPKPEEQPTKLARLRP
jgi:hypothetical protein